MNPRILAVAVALDGPGQNVIRAKLAAVGFGVFIPVFFVSSGVRFDLDALTDAVVEEAGPATGYGLWVVLRHTDGTQSGTRYLTERFWDGDAR